MRPHLLLIAALLAGCSQAGVGDETESSTSLAPTTTGSSTVATAPETPTAKEPPSWDSLQLEGCRAAYSTFTWPGAMGPGTTVPGWEPAPTLESSSVFMEFLACERVAIGALERGPLELMVELHDRHQPPIACQGDARYLHLLHRVWLEDDGLLAAFQAWHIPAGKASLGWTATTNEETWTIEAEGQRSSVSWLAATDDTQAPFETTVRWAWLADGDLTVLDLTQTTSDQLTGAALTPGHVVAPLLYAQGGPAEYAGHGQTAAAVTYSGDKLVMASPACD